MYLPFKIKFEEPFFEDMEPEKKTTSELIYIILKDTKCTNINDLKYNNREINQCARKLILNGYLRGTIFDYKLCTWSKLTMKGRYLLDRLESEYRSGF